MKRPIRKRKNLKKASRDEPKVGERSGLIYGAIPVLELLRAGERKIEKILVQQGSGSENIGRIIEEARGRKIRFENVSRSEFARYLDKGTTHQGVLAFTTPVSYYDPEKLLDEISANPGSLSLILDGIQDPRNLGAIVRTAECAGVDGIFAPERRAVGLNETVAKAAAGATEFVKVAKVTNINRLIDSMKENQIWVVGTSGGSGTDYTEWDWQQPTALVLGGEGKGLHRLTADKCDVLIEIPMRGRIASLNVSVAAGVVLFEALRQRL